MKLTSHTHCNRWMLDKKNHIIYLIFMYCNYQTRNLNGIGNLSTYLKKHQMIYLRLKLYRGLTWSNIWNRKFVREKKTQRSDPFKNMRENWEHPPRLVVLFPWSSIIVEERRQWFCFVFLVWDSESCFTESLSSEYWSGSAVMKSRVLTGLMV